VRMACVGATPSKSSNTLTTFDLQHELRVAESAARDASQLIMAARPAVLESNLVRQKPGGEGPVTHADMQADQLIRSRLLEAFPLDHVITEESFTEATHLPTEGRVWMVDPLDGTKCFVDPESTDFCVMIGMCIDGHPSLGVIMEPSTGRLWKGVNTNSLRQAWAVQSNQTEEAILPFPGVLGDSLRFATAPPVNPRMANLVSSMVMPAVAVPMGSAGLKAMAILEGKADMYSSCFKQISLWDVCAGHAILSAMGGRLTTLQLMPIDYSERRLKDGLFFHQPGVDAELQVRIKLMYEYIEDRLASRTNR